jgi:hypothetical protein
MNVAICKYGAMCNTKTMVLGAQSRAKKGQLNHCVLKKEQQCMSKRSPPPRVNHNLVPRSRVNCIVAFNRMPHTHVGCNESMNAGIKARKCS